jgi:hypothetical protein
MTETQTWIFASVGAFAILSLITYGMTWEVQKRVRKLEKDSEKWAKRICRQAEEIRALEYVVTGGQDAFNIHTGHPNPNMGVKELQKRVELILDKLGVEVGDGARLVEREGSK